MGGVVKRLWGFDKVRYRGLAKNATRSFVALRLANIFLARGVLYGKVRPFSAGRCRRSPGNAQDPADASSHYCPRQKTQYQAPALGKKP